MLLKGIKIINGIDQNNARVWQQQLLNMVVSIKFLTHTAVGKTSPLTFLTQILQIKIELKFLSVGISF